MIRRHFLSSPHGTLFVMGCGFLVAGIALVVRGVRYGPILVQVFGVAAVWIVLPLREYFGKRR